ncbi:hypothetical protein KAI04_04155 [Candidatus Pacearchaeota archaeon]|nr:hypothetical protein [Candidatus Pacearchaeota archaeon]
MKQETKERMNRLVLLNAKKRLQDASEEIIVDFKKEGFDRSQIYRYIYEIITEDE